MGPSDAFSHLPGTASRRGRGASVAYLLSSATPARAGPASRGAGVAEVCRTAEPFRDVFCDSLPLSRPHEPSADQLDRHPHGLGDQWPAPLRGEGGPAFAPGQGQAAAVAERQASFERDGAQHAGVGGQRDIERHQPDRQRAEQGFDVARTSEWYGVLS